MWAGAFVLICWMTIASWGKGGLPSWSDPFWLAVLLFGAVSGVLRFRYGRDIRWSIEADEIGIDGDNGAFRVKQGDVLEIEIFEQLNGRFRIRLWCASGRRFVSPPVDDAQRAHELKAEIARRLGVTNT